MYSTCMNTCTGLQELIILCLDQLSLSYSCSLIKYLEKNLLTTNVIDHFQVTLCFCFKRLLMQNLSYENEFDLHENKSVRGIHFHGNGFTQRLVFTQG